MDLSRRIEHLVSQTTSVIVDVSSGIPAIVHWGAPVLAVSTDPESVVWSTDVQPFGAVGGATPLQIVPMHGDGFAGRPGLAGHRRGGRHWSPRFHYLEHDLVRGPGPTADQVLTVRAIDDVAALVITSRLELSHDGVLSTRVTVDNRGDSPYMVDALSVSLALPENAAQLGVYSGRWAREFDLHRFPWPYGAWTSENRSGRTSHEHPPYIWALENGTGEWSGQAWGVHLAWSGNHVLYAETLVTGQRYIQSGELFQPGEMCLDPGQSLDTPQVIGVYSERGLTPASWGFHSTVRRHSPRPQARPRPVHINTWEAVYFDHDLDRLCHLADVAAATGIERFVLDDGWFGARRHDRAGLGDWMVSVDVYPQGLFPLIEHVVGLGMEFGIWVEPEMVNPDSDLYRQHPDWVLASDGYQPILGRHQLVLDLTNERAWQYIHDQLDALLGDHRISYVKWDMNRPHIQASTSDGKAATHAQTLAVYVLIDSLRQRHAHIEFESCASGGGRIDHEMLRRVERVWTSDSNDAHERQLIQRGASMVIPPEVMGSHIGPRRSHTTQRRHSLSFRAVTALFGHLGVEWDITTADENERAHLAYVIELYKTYRHLLHGGDTVRFDIYGSLSGEHVAGHRSVGTALAHGVYAKDRHEALICYVQLATPEPTFPQRLRLPDLLADQIYDVVVLPLDPGGRGAVSNAMLGPTTRQPAWMTTNTDGVPYRLSGSALAAVGLPMPLLWPESAVLVHLSSS